MEVAWNITRTIDPNIDIGADAVDYYSYKYVSLCSLPFARLVHPPLPTSYSTLTSSHPLLYRSIHPALGVIGYSL
jgi:hypothetical protein